MNIELEALREAIDQAARSLADVEKGQAEPKESEAMLKLLRAQLGAMRATHAALLEMDARLAGYSEAVP
jgi:hypothetical protein